MRRIEVDIGRRDRANEGAIVRVVCESAGIPSSMIGRIVLDENSACFEVREPVAERVLKSLRGALFDGRPVRVRDAKALAARARTKEWHCSPCYP